MATSGKGLPFIGKMNEFLDKVLHPTVNKVGHSKAAMDVTSRAYFAVNDILTPSAAEAGSTDNILVSTGLDAIAGDIIRFVSTANDILEREITVHEVVDADTVILAGYLSSDIAIGDTFHLLRPTVTLVSEDGASLATVISPPIQIIKNGTVQTVEDSTTPADVVAIPVKIMAVDGTNINITAGDIDINTTAEGSNFDSMRIGDGTAKYASITANDELSVHDADALAELVTLNTTDFATETSLAALLAKDMASEAKQDLIIAEIQDVEAQLVTLNAKPLATETKQDTQITALADINTELDTQTTRLNLLATETTQAAGNVLIGAVTETAPATDTGSSGLNGRLQRIAQRLTSLIALLPASLGQKVSASSLAVVFASDQSALTVNQSVQVGTYDQSLTIANSGVTTLTAPANAKSCKVMAGGNNPSDLKVTLDGSNPTATRGMQFQAGRSEDFVGVVSLKVIAVDVSTTNELYVHWSV